MRLFVLHYHLLPGGVTDVIRGSLSALLLARSDIEAITLIAGREEHAHAVVSALRLVAPELSITLLHWQELDYSNQQETDEEAEGRTRIILNRLQERVTEPTDLLWVHNYHLGKNAALTMAIERFASSPSGRKTAGVLLQVHDFPEEGRYVNLAYLKRICAAVPYPIEGRVRFATINTRDHELLVAAGVPRERVHYLPNPIAGKRKEEEALSVHGRRERLVLGLSSFARDSGQRFHADGPVVLYPVRAIRRKNVLELAMICRLMPNWNLVVTLPGTSRSERAYSELIDYAYRDRRIHGCFGIGQNEHRYGLTFEDIFHGSDLVASSSVQEGFGLTFLNTLQARLPLLARRLPTMGGLLPMFDGYPAHLYERFLVPLSSPGISSMRGYLRMRYGERLDEIAAAVPQLADRIEQQIHDMIDADAIDVSFLPAQLQLTLLGDLRDREFAEQVRALNTGVLNAAAQLAEAECPDVSERVEQAFGPLAFAARFDEVVAGYSRDGEQTGSQGREIADRMATSLTGVEQARLLLGPLDHDA
jgi:hypothetical protein